MPLSPIAADPPHLPGISRVQAKIGYHGHWWPPTCPRPPRVQVTKDRMNFRIYSTRSTAPERHSGDWIERYFKVEDDRYNDGLLWLLRSLVGRLKSAAKRRVAAIPVVDARGASLLTNPPIDFSKVKLSTESCHSLSATSNPLNFHWEGHGRGSYFSLKWGGPWWVSMGSKEGMKFCEKSCRLCNDRPWIENEGTVRAPCCPNKFHPPGEAVGSLRQPVSKDPGPEYYIYHRWGNTVIVIRTDYSAVAAIPVPGSAVNRKPGNTHNNNQESSLATAQRPTGPTALLQTKTFRCEDLERRGLPWRTNLFLVYAKLIF